MSKVQILTALLLSYLVCSCAEETGAQKRIDDILRPPIYIETSVAPPEEPSYLSKITNWFNLFGGNEKKTTIIHANIPPGPPGPSLKYHGPPSPLNGSPPPLNGPTPPLNGPTPPLNGPPPQLNGPPPPLNGPLPPLNGLPSQFDGPPKNYGPPQTFKPHPSQGLTHGPPIYKGPSVSSQVPPNLNGPPPLKLKHPVPQNNHISGPGPVLSAQGTSNQHQYLPPHQSLNQDKECNPCNQEPWVPIVSNYGSNTLIGFVPQSNVGNKGQGIPNGVYGQPNRPSKEYGIPPVPPSNQYGTPNLNNGHIRPPKDYGVPPPPPSNQYGPPNFNNGPSLNHGSLNSQYGPPPSSQYGPPNSGLEEIAPPKLHDKHPSNNYGPPNIGGPSIKYGPPKHRPAFLPTPNPIIPNKYGPPSFSHPRRPRPHLPPPPNSFIGPPPSLTKYGPPSNNFGHELSPQSNSLGGFGVPSTPLNSYGPPPSGPAHVPPLKPPSNYGPPLTGPSTGYGPPKPSPPTNSYGPPLKPSIEYGPPLKFGTSPTIPISNYAPPPNPSGNGNKYLPPFPTPTASAVSNNYDFPPSSFSDFDSLPKNSQAPFVTPVPTKNGKGPLQNSYGPPPAGPVRNHEQVKITSEEYLPPPQELPISNGNDNNYEPLSVPPVSQPNSGYNGVLDPIPFPNMSPTFILPIRNAYPFRNKNNPSAGDNLSSQGSNVPVHTGNGGNIPNHEQSNVQISQSVPVAEFLSTIEYPPNVVQSPLIDLVVDDIANIENIDTPQQNNNNEFPNQNNNNEFPKQNNNNEFPKQNNNNEFPKQNNNGYQVNFKDNPIIVDGDEHHQEASDNHASVAIHDAISTKLTFSPNILNTLEDSKPKVSVLKNQEFKNTSVTDNVQIDASLQTLLQDENLASIIAKQLLNENKNPPKPFAPSENSPQSLVTQVNQNAQATNNALFTQPTLDYSNWNPSVGGISTGMQPPAPSQNSWISTNNYVQYTTKKPKQIQIIVPYTTNNKGNNWHQKDSRKILPSVSTSVPYNPSISLFGKLPSAEESQWSKYIDHNFQESKTSIAQTPSPISNIQDFFKDTTVNIDASHSQNLPFDILKLQQNIDVWTEQEFNKIRFDAQSSTTSRFAYSKKIPDEYLTTQSINQAQNEVTTSSPNNRNSKLFHNDYLGSSSVHHSVEARPHNLTELTNIDSNLLEDVSSTMKPEVTPATWDKIQVTISPLTNERVYVVTPLPWETGASTPQSAWSYVPKNEIRQINKQLADNANFVFNSPRFAVRPEPVQMNKSNEDVNNKIHLVYSDWPELINSLATTTSAATSHSTTASTATPHPLLGRMDISQHTPAPARQEGTVQTYTGHSKVVTAVTASSGAKKITEREDKKFTTTTKKTPTSNKM